MIRLKETILMLCFILSGALCYAHDEARTGNEKDWVPIPIETTEATGASGSDRSSSILPALDGHVLTVVFNENLGQVSIEVATASGTPVECTSIQTPNGLQIFIPNAGDYIVTFTLPNGDEYYGEFTVTD